MGFLEVLTIIFIVLKVVGVISWSWWLVLSPVIIAVGIYGVMLAFFGTILGIGGRKIAKGKRGR